MATLKHVAFALTLAAAAATSSQFAFAQQAHPKSVIVRRSFEARKDVREQRPLSLAASALGKTPMAGASLDINPHPNFALGVGYGVFKLSGVSGSLIPAFLHVLLLRNNFTPYFIASLNFVTLQFEAKGSLLASKFRGTQGLLGAGFEHRFDFGPLIRTELVRYMNAELWAPGLALGYSFKLF
ncbi:MAG: hypothetical protein AB1540_04465 [Bdellovibrionota bacterium]